MRYGRITRSFFVLLFIGFGARDAASADAPPKLRVPKVGTLAVEKDQYKPVVGKPGGRLVNCSPSEPKSFNPITAAETTTTIFTAHMFQGLTDMDAFTGAMKPRLCEKWEVDKDGLTWTFHLRKDVVFNDGTPFTAQDVVFTWNDLIYDLSRPSGSDPRWPCSGRDITTFDGKIIQVSAPDDYTVKFITPVKVAIVDQIVAAPILSKKKYAPMVQNGTFGAALGSDSKPEDIVGTGPFVLGQYSRGERITLKRNPNFWMRDAANQKLPYLDEIVYVIARDLNTWLLNFDQKIVDVYPLRGGADVARLRPQQQPNNFTLYQLGPSYGTFFIAFNLNLDAAAQQKLPDYKVKWFRDLRFRQAVSYAIDRGALVRNVLRNMGYPLAAPYTLAAGPFRQDGFSPIPHDPEKAKSLLAEMGFKSRDSSGVLSDAEGHKLSFTLNTNMENDVRTQMADFIRKDLQSVGMDVNTLFLQFNLLAEKMDRTFDWECIIMGLTGGEEPQFGANVWKSNGRVHFWWPREKTPSFDWEGRIDKIFLDGVQELDPAKRKALYRDWVQIVYDQQPMIYLTTPEVVIALRNRFGNIFPPPTSAGLFHNEEEIFVRDEAQGAGTR